MRIEIWSDIVCPWCYIGKRRFEKALAAFKHAEDVEIIYRSFQLDPSAPAVPVETVPEALGSKYGGGPEAGRQMVDRVAAVAAEEGLSFRYHEALRVNTVDAHRLLHLALAEGRQSELNEALLLAYFVEILNIADHETLVRLAVGAGLDEGRVRTVLDGEEYADAVESDIGQAAALGATGVPFFVIDRRYGVSGAQPVKVFGEVLDKAWADGHPDLQMTLGADACGPDGCAI